MIDIAMYWADFFGIEPRLLEQTGVRVARHKVLAGYNGAWIFQHGTSLVVSVPAKEFMKTKERAERILDCRRAIDVTDAVALFGNDAKRIIGPAYQGYITHSNFRPAPPSNISVLTEFERPALLSLAYAVGAEDWAHSSLDPEDRHIFAAVCGEEILAAANVKEIDGAMMLGVVTSPGQRGRGLGKAVVSAAVNFALGSGLPIRF